jgi:hypothetical protein
MQHRAGIWNWDAYEAYCLANRLELVQLQDRIMDTLRAAEVRAGAYPDLETLQITFVKCGTKTGNAMRRYLVDWLHWMILQYNEGGSPVASWGDIHKELEECNDLRLAVEKRMRGQAGREVPQPREAPNCTYHHHHPYPKCPYKKDFK